MGYEIACVPSSTTDPDMRTSTAAFMAPMPKTTMHAPTAHTTSAAANVANSRSPEREILVASNFGAVFHTTK